jgi:hypothetical protein
LSKAIKRNKTMSGGCVIMNFHQKNYLNLLEYLQKYVKTGDAAETILAEDSQLPVVRATSCFIKVSFFSI